MRVIHIHFAALLVLMTVICAGSTLLVLLLMLRLRRTVTELQSAKDRAESASRAKSEFLADLSHEMRTPLHAILSFAELGGRRAASLTPEKATRYYKMIEEGGRRLLDLLNDLVDLAGLEAGKRVLRFASAPFEAVVVGVVEELRPLFQSRGIGLEVSSCETTSGRIDREALMQVLRYVVTNAAKWSVPGGTVAIALVRSELGSLLSVTSRGSGTVQAGREVAFERILNSDSPQIGTGCSGLKLAICRQIMTAHGGRIWAETREGWGATVYLEIPDRKSLPDEGEAPRPAAAA
jgi:signal transduction histidine kinase